MATAQGQFTVTITPQGDASTADGTTLGRSALAKVFSGDLHGTGSGEMLSALTGVKGSAGYVAIERVTGTLDGRTGSFVLQHTGLMDKGAPTLSIVIVPDSGTGELTGISGVFHLTIANGVHAYRLEYALA